MFIVKLIQDIKKTTTKRKHDSLPTKQKTKETTKRKSQLTQQQQQFNTPKPEEKGSSLNNFHFLPLDLENENCDFEMASSDDEDDQFIPIQQTTIKKENEFVSLDVVGLVTKQQTEIINISSTLGLPVCISGTLIRAYQWNQEK